MTTWVAIPTASLRAVAAEATVGRARRFRRDHVDGTVGKFASKALAEVGAPREGAGDRSEDDVTVSEDEPIGHRASMDDARCMRVRALQTMVVRVADGIACKRYIPRV